MGILGLQKFVEENMKLLRTFRLHDCNVLLDGNSIYHQMYSECKLICLFGGEYDEFYYYCKQIFKSFQTCRIKAIVVFDGARIDERKWDTAIERATERVKRSTQVSSDVNLSPLLLHQTFLNVLNDMQIPYVQALGEGDEECVSLANHLDCYLIAKDSDYYCYDLMCGYVSFDYLDLEPKEGTNYYYLSASIYTVNSLLDQFVHLNTSTLALACCLCGNDYISAVMTRPIVNRIRSAVDEQNITCIKKNKTIHWYTMQWLRRFRDDLEQAIGQSLEFVEDISERRNIETKLRAALQCYLKPSDTLIYRFILEENKNLRKNQHFIQLAKTYLESLKMSTEQVRTQIDKDSSNVKTKRNNRLPSMLIDSSSDLRLAVLFLEVLIDRRFIYSAHIEVESQPSIYAEVIPMLQPILASFLKWDGEQEDQSVTFYHRVGKQLKACNYSLKDFNDQEIEFDKIHLMSLIGRQNFVCRLLSVTNDLTEIHSDYHLWLLIIRRWYSTRKLSPVYVYAIIISFIRSICITNYNNNCDDDNPLQQVESILSIPLDINHFRMLINDEKIRQNICARLDRMIKYSHCQKTVDVNDVNIIYEFNCLQTTSMIGWQINEFFDKPFSARVQPQHFLNSSFLYAFVRRYKNKKSNLTDAEEALLLNEPSLLEILRKLLKCIIRF